MPLINLHSMRTKSSSFQLPGSLVNPASHMRPVLPLVDVVDVLDDAAVENIGVLMRMCSLP